MEIFGFETKSSRKGLNFLLIACAPRIMTFPRLRLRSIATVKAVIRIKSNKVRVANHSKNPVIKSPSNKIPLKSYHTILKYVKKISM